MKTNALGFTLIELLLFILISSFVASTVMMGAVVALRATPTISLQWKALGVVRGCMERALQSKRLNGYSSVICPSTTSCTSPAGFSTSVQYACTTWNGDTSYRTITVTTTGLSNASLQTMVSNY